LQTRFGEQRITTLGTGRRGVELLLGGGIVAFLFEQRGAFNRTRCRSL